MGEKGATWDRAITRTAARQHGVVSIGQLRLIGVSENAVSRRVRSGRLHRVHRGVYAVGHDALSDEARWIAAILACGRSRSETGTVLAFWAAALSHRSAACLWGLLDTREGSVDVSVPSTWGRKKRRGIRVHRSRSLTPSDVTLRNGIPVTTPARTIADLRRSISGSGQLISAFELRQAVRQANVLGLPVDEETRRERSRSDLELDFHGFCKRFRFPPPEVNVRVGRHLVDFLWRERRLIVETDGYNAHRGRAAFQEDRARDLALRARGFQVIRLSEKQLNEEADLVAKVLRRALRVGADG